MAAPHKQSAKSSSSYNYNDIDSAVLERIRRNDPELTSVVLREPHVLLRCPSLDAFVTVLETSNNTHVTSVIVKELVVQMTTATDLCRLLEALGHLPALQAVEFHLPQFDSSKTLSADSVARFLERTKRQRQRRRSNSSDNDNNDSDNNDNPCTAAAAAAFQTLVLWPFVSLESMDQVQTLADALKDHPSLKTLAFMSIRLTSLPQPQQQQTEEEELQTTERICIDPILTALATVPCLEMLQLSLGVNVHKQHSQVAIENPESLTMLLQQQQQKQQQEDQPQQKEQPSVPPKKQRQGLQALALRNFGLTDEYCTAMAETLASESLRHSTTLRFLDLRFNCISIAGYHAVLDMLSYNDRLEWVELDDNPYDYFCRYPHMRLQIEFEGDTIAEQRERLRRAEERAAARQALIALKGQIQFFLSLNRAGRYTLLKDSTATKADCIDVLYKAATQDDQDEDEAYCLSLVFYLLTNRPSLCDA